MSKSNRKLFEFLIAAGTKTEAKATTIATSVLYLHRFLKAAPPNVIGNDHYTAASVCLYLAGKVEEDFIRIRDIINVTHRMLHRDEPLLDVDDRYWTIRDGMSKLEMLVLRYLGFRMQHEHPHKYLLHFAKTLESWLDRDVLQQCPCIKTAWSILNDCYLEPELILENKPQFIAAALLYISLRIYGITVPYADSNDERPWWTILSDIESDNLLKLSNKILDTVEIDKP